MDIFEEIKKLDFPLGEYIVVGSGIMAAKKIKEAYDIDIVVTKNIFNDCKNSGNWEVLQWTYEKPGQIFLRQGLVELYLDVNSRDFNPTTEELIERAEIVNGVPFTSFADTIKFKTEYAKGGKEKHLKDIALIEKYLETYKN